MIRRLIILLLIVIFLPSCAQYWEYFSKATVAATHATVAATHITLHFTKQISKHIEYCKEECKANKEQSDEWCNCMDECYRKKYDSPDENIIFCLSDSTNTTPPE